MAYIKNRGRTARCILRKKGITAPVFFGIFYTCDMRYETVQALLPAYRGYAKRKETQLELMFHPGNLMSGNEMFDTRRGELADFYMSQNRLCGSGMPETDQQFRGARIL